jgi:DNA ligase 1
MLRQPGSLYEVGRSQTLLKVKTFFDAEALVIDYTDGKGKHKGRLGALVVQLPDGTEFNIGTGFSDAQRETPPVIGSMVTFRYQELTDGGVPRFPSFLRVAGTGKSTGSRSKSSKPIGTPTTPQAEKAITSSMKQAAQKASDLTMDYYEFSDGKSEKFWEIGRNGCDVTVRYGRIGTTGQTLVKSLDSEEAAQKHHDKLIEEKTGKGYQSTKKDA